MISVNNGNFLKSYLNGILPRDYTVQAVDDRWSLAPYLYLFGDDDGDDGSIDVAEVAIWDYALNETEIATLGNVGTVLPVELTSFNAVQSNGNVILNWETATEINNSGFTIERKSDSDNWKSLGFVSGHGTTSDKHSYSFTDQLNGSGKYFYRLKQVDYNGKFEYSNIAEVLIAPTEFKLYNNYPNPFNPSTIIAYELAADAFVTLKVYNATGELVADLVNEYQVSGKYNKSFNTTSINHSLASGIYFAELRANEKVQRIKMMLLK